MKKQYILLAILACAAGGLGKALYADAKSAWKKFKGGVSSAAHSAEHAVENEAHSIEQKIKSVATSFEQAVLHPRAYEEKITSEVRSELTNLAKDEKELGSTVTKMVTNWVEPKEKPSYCKFTKPPLEPYTIDQINAELKKNPKFKIKDINDWWPTIVKYAPIIWLQPGEDFYPIKVGEYFTGPQTTIKCCYNSDTSRGESKQVIVPAGKITFQKIWDLYTEYQKAGKDFNLWIDNAHCTRWGSDPAKNKDKDGNLTTPVYFIAYEYKDNIYVQYLYFYGYNGPFDVGFLKGDVTDIQDAHEGDLEHVTAEIDKKTKVLKRIYYGSHGTHEGFWLDPKNPDIDYEGTHPIGYSSHYSHGVYPKEGTFVRIFGAASDVTGKGLKWKPTNLVPLFTKDDPNFDPATLGWMYFPGQTGARGVQPVTGQGWFMNSQGSTTDPSRTPSDFGRPYTPKKWFCKNPSGKNEAQKIEQKIEYEECITKAIPNATIPE